MGSLKAYYYMQWWNTWTAYPTHRNRKYFSGYFCPSMHGHVQDSNNIIQTKSLVSRPAPPPAKSPSAFFYENCMPVPVNNTTCPTRDRKVPWAGLNCNYVGRPVASSSSSSWPVSAYKWYKTSFLFFAQSKYNRRFENSWYSAATQLTLQVPGHVHMPFFDPGHHGQLGRCMHND